MAFVGSALTFSVKFTDAAGSDADPDNITFWLREGIDGTELEWTYNASPVEGTHYPVGMNPIVRDSLGDFSLVFVSRKPERHTGFWQGSGTIFQVSQVTAFVPHSDIAALEL